MIALYHLIAWSVLLGFTAFCAQPPNQIPFGAFYEPCEAGLSRFYAVNQNVLHHPVENHLFLDNLDNHIAMLDNLENRNELAWFNHMTRLFHRTTHVIHLALHRLDRFGQWIDQAIDNNALPPWWHNPALESRGFLQQCHGSLSQIVNPPGPNVQLVAANPQFTAYCDQVPNPIDFGAFYMPCQDGISRLHDLHTEVSGLYAEVQNLNINYPNLLFPFDRIPPMLPNLSNLEDLLWLNRMSSLISMTYDVLRSAVTQLRDFILWLNRVITSPNQLLPLDLPLVLRNNARATNALLVQCSHSLLQLIRQPPNIQVDIDHNPEPQNVDQNPEPQNVDQNPEPQNDQQR